MACDGGLGEEPDLSAGQVADRTAMDKVAVSRAVNKLLETGRIERHFANEDSAAQFWRSPKLETKFTVKLYP